MKYGKIRYSVRVLLIVLIFCLFSTNICFGEIQIVQTGNWSLENYFEIRYGLENLKAYTYGEIQKSYIANDPETKTNELNFQTNDLEYRRYTLQFNSISDSIARYRELADQYRTLAKKYQDEMNASAGAQKEAAMKDMQQNLLNSQTYEAELADAVTKKAEIYVQKENCKFIIDNSETLKKQQKTIQLSQFRNTVYQIKLLDENYNQQGVLADYAKLQEETQKINMVKDMAFQADIDLYNADYCYYIGQQDLLKQQIDNEFEKLLDTAALSTTQGAIMTTDIRDIRTPNPIEYSYVENNSILNDTKKKQLDDKLRILDGKLTILKEYYSDNSSQVQELLNEKALTTLEISKWTIQRKNILKNSYSVYKSKFNEIGINAQKAKALYDSQIVLLNKYNYGLASKISEKEAEVKYIQSDFALWSTIFDYAAALSKIENCISGRIE
jgi:hypothetical protein